jgi:hypothetical protein
MHIDNAMLLVLELPKFLSDSGLRFLVPLYLGPETIMPLASVLGAIVGFLLIFWRSILKAVKKVFRSSRTPLATPENHSSLAESQDEPQE